MILLIFMFFALQAYSIEVSRSELEQALVNEPIGLDKQLESREVTPAILFTSLKLPLQFSHKKRHENIEAMSENLDNFIVFEGYHSYDKYSMNHLIQKAAELEIFFSPHYRSNMSKVVTLGKPGIIVSFLNIFEQTRNLEKFDCLVVIENDFILSHRDLPTIQKECTELLADGEHIFSRFADYNYANVYNLALVHKIHESILNTTMTRPFDHYTRVNNFFRQGPRLLRSRLLQLPSTLNQQAHATVLSWNKCLNLVRESKGMFHGARSREEEREEYDKFDFVESCKLDLMVNKPKDNCPWKGLDPMWRPNPCK